MDLCKHQINVPIFSSNLFSIQLHHCVPRGFRVTHFNWGRVVIYCEQKSCAQVANKEVEVLPLLVILHHPPLSGFSEDAHEKFLLESNYLESCQGLRGPACWTCLTKVRLHTPIVYQSIN